MKILIILFVTVMLGGCVNKPYYVIEIYIPANSSEYLMSVKIPEKEAEYYKSRNSDEKGNYWGKVTGPYPPLKK